MVDQGKMVTILLSHLRLMLGQVVELQSFVPVKEACCAVVLLNGMQQHKS